MKTEDIDAKRNVKHAYLTLHFLYEYGTYNWTNTSEFDTKKCAPNGWVTRKRRVDTEELHGMDDKKIDEAKIPNSLGKQNVL